ncbi:hypothetical protein SAMN06296386_112110 [Lachnospiraceae bacterium]|nr:hypothetical protein SAMN06296386_112110 [Lachnospiraceae bacterium]
MKKTDSELIYYTLSGEKCILNSDKHMEESLTVILSELSTMRSFISEVIANLVLKEKESSVDDDRSTILEACQLLLQFQSSFGKLLPELYESLVNTISQLEYGRFCFEKKISTGTIERCPTINYDKDNFLILRDRLFALSLMPGAIHLHMDIRLQVICSYMEWSTDKLDAYNFTLNAEGFRLILSPK